MIRKNEKVIAVLVIVAAATALSPMAAAAGVTNGAVEKWYLARDLDINPYDRNVADQVEKLCSSSVHVRAAAAEALGYLRAYNAAGNLVGMLGDEHANVRREAAMSLAWCGAKEHLDPLVDALEDSDWTVRQAAWVSLTNLTAMEWPFDALAKAKVRKQQVSRWRTWCKTAANKVSPAEIFQLVAGKDMEGRLRGVRALGSFGGEGASEAIIKVVLPYRDKEYRKINPLEKNVVLSGLRSLGRLHDPDALPILISFLDTKGWARYAADALGDFGSVEAVSPLVAAYPRFAKDLNRRLAKVWPGDDRAKLGWNPEDRMYETPYSIILALSRLVWDDSVDAKKTSDFCMLLLANIPSDWDGGLLFQPEAFEVVTAYLLERAGLRQMACDAAFKAADEPRGPWREGDYYDAPPVDKVTTEQALAILTKAMYQDVPFFAKWFPALCRESEDVPRLIKLLENDSGWIRINAAKALMFMGDKRGIEPIARILAESNPEGAYGYSGVLEHAEYDDPAPRWRESFARALGRLGAAEHSMWEF